MSVNAISSMSGASFSSSSTSSSTALTDATKKQLESLGIDTSQIKTEAEGQQKLKETQATQASQSGQSAQGQQQQNGASSEIDTIKAQATDLASQLGVSVSDNDKVEDILENISTKLTEMTVQAGNDPQKLQELSQYESQFEMIGGEYLNLQAQKQASQGQLTGSLNNLANYNKIFFNL